MNILQSKDSLQTSLMTKKINSSEFKQNNRDAVKDQPKSSDLGQLVVNAVENQAYIKQSSSTQIQELLQAQLTVSSSYALSSTILEGTPITENMRARLRSFLMAQTSKQCIFRKTCVLACMYIDLFFLNKGVVQVSDFQNLALSCLILATKMEEGKFPTIDWKIFSRQELLSYERKIAKKLNYRLNPTTYNDFAQRLVLLWDFHVEIKKLYNAKFYDQPQGVNRKLRAFYQQLDCTFMTLKSLDYDVQSLTINLFYIHVRMFNVPQMLEPQQLSDAEFVKVFYPSKDKFKTFFEEFLGFYSKRNIKLDIEMGKFLKNFLMVTSGATEWKIQFKRPIMDKIRVHDRIQSVPKDNYLMVKSINEKLAGQRQGQRRK